MIRPALKSRTSAYSLACRDCALGLLKTAREVNADPRNAAKVAKLVDDIRWHWRRYLMFREL